MSSIFRRKGLKRWYFSYFDHNGKRITRVGTYTKEGTRRIADKLEEGVRLREEGVLDPAQERYADHEKRLLRDTWTIMKNGWRAGDALKSTSTEPSIISRSLSIHAGLRRRPLWTPGRWGPI